MVPDKPQKVENFHFTWCGYIGFRTRWYDKRVTLSRNPTFKSLMTSWKRFLRPQKTAFNLRKKWGCFLFSTFFKIGISTLKCLSQEKKFHANLKWKLKLCMWGFQSSDLFVFSTLLQKCLVIAWLEEHEIDAFFTIFNITKH